MLNKSGYRYWKENLLGTSFVLVNNNISDPTKLKYNGPEISSWPSSRGSPHVEYVWDQHAVRHQGLCGHHWQHHG